MELPPTLHALRPGDGKRWAHPVFLPGTGRQRRGHQEL
jgi:hypothetical protein